MAKKYRAGDKSPYWGWVSSHGGIEPPENNPEDIVDPSSEEPAEATNYGARFTAWLATGFRQLTERQKQVFQAAFENKLSDARGADQVGVSLQRYANIKGRVRKIIAREVGIRI